MNLIQKWSGKEAIKIYKEQINQNPPPDDILKKSIDYIELLEIKSLNHNFNAYFVYSKEVVESEEDVSLSA